MTHWSLSVSTTFPSRAKALEHWSKIWSLLNFQMKELLMFEAWRHIEGTGFNIIVKRNDRAYKSGLSYQQESKVVEKAIRSKWSLRSIAALFRTDTSTIKYICNKFKRKEAIREISITTRRAENRSFISWEHIEAVKIYLGAFLEDF